MQYCIDCKHCLPYEAATLPKLRISLARCGITEEYQPGYVAPIKYDPVFRFCDIVRKSETCDMFEAI